jgi:precorrin-6Y C5,15-methyltransferase (decarboxylating)
MFHYLRDPKEIVRRSFEIIDAEADLSALPPDIAEVTKRVVHACGMPELVADFAWSEAAVAVGKAALAGGAPIVCDVRMVAAGLTTRSLANDVLVAIEHGEEPSARETRTAAGLARLADRLAGAVVAIGNAPTALFRLLELVASGAGKPALVLGFPVGFVGAAESKDALANNTLGIPFITLKGRRGGSAMASAAVNAIVSMTEGSRRTAVTPSASTAGRNDPQRWLSIVGIGEDGVAGLSAAAKRLIAESEILIGGNRHLAMAPDGGAERLSWPSPMEGLVERIPTMRGRRVCVLASGDPMHFGVGATLAARIPADEMMVVPAPSAFALAAARLAWPLDRTTLISLHGRSVETLAAHVFPGARLIALTTDGKTPEAVARWLVAHGFGDSRMAALAHIGGPHEARFHGSAKDWSADVPDLNTLAIECVAGAGAHWHPRTAGLPDDAFEHDGQLTKREARALALARLKPHPGALLWDIGAGCGSISVEWQRAAPRTRAIALEPNADRRAMAARNALALGVGELDIRDGRAPEALSGLPPPDAAFFGGGLSDESVEATMASLRPGGRLVAHAVTLESEALLLDAHRRHDGDLIRLAVVRDGEIGGMTGWRPAMPVTQWAWEKR